MAKEFITIQESADISKKSIQTIRRAIKAHKIKYKKIRTPQGFNYLINYKSLCELYDVKMEPNVKEEIKNEKKSSIETSKKDIHISAEDFRDFTKTMERLISQHSEERQNFLRLVNTLQEKIFVLENQLNLLKSPAKKWYQLWK